MKTTYYAAKLNVHENIFSTDLKTIISEYIPNAILSGMSTKINSYNVQFTDVEKIKFEEHELIVGNITKSKKPFQKIRDGNKTALVKSPLEIANTSFFVYHPIFEIIVYGVNANIKIKDFLNFFTNLISKDPHIGEVRIYNLPVPIEIKSKIDQIDTVTSISLKLIQPNPGKDEHSEFQKIIDETNAKEANIKIQNADGLKLYAENEIGRKEKFVSSIDEALKLVESGYGSMVVSGFNESFVEGKRNKQRKIKKPKKINTEKSLQQITSDKTGDNLFRDIYTFIERIIKENRREG